MALKVIRAECLFDALMASAATFVVPVRGRTAIGIGAALVRAVLAGVVVVVLTTTGASARGCHELVDDNRLLHDVLHRSTHFGWRWQCRGRRSDAADAPGRAS